jgi:hypothetical protein
VLGVLGWILVDVCVVLSAFMVAGWWEIEPRYSLAECAMSLCGHSVSLNDTVDEYASSQA